MGSHVLSINSACMFCFWSFWALWEIYERFANRGKEGSDVSNPWIPASREPALEMWINRRASFCTDLEEHKLVVTGRGICHPNKLTKWKNKHPSYQSAFFCWGWKCLKKNHKGIHGNSRRLNSTVVPFEVYDHEVNCQNCSWKRW